MAATTLLKITGSSNAHQAWGAVMSCMYIPKFGLSVSHCS